MTKVKMCGITNYEDSINAINLGADYLGFNFYNHSPRYIAASKARNIIKKLPKNIKKVGVFVNENIKNIKKLINFCNIDIIQLSGDENGNFISNLEKVSNKKIIKSFRIKDSRDIEKIKHFKTDYILLDSFKEGLYGGAGSKFDWSIINNAHINKKTLFLAGGLNASNVKLAIKELSPYAVDVCSSIEAYPGKKDYKKMKEFIEALK